MGTILGRDNDEETTPVNSDLVNYRNEQAKIIMSQEFDINDLPSTTERPLSPYLSTNK